MNNIAEIKERYLRDSIPIQLGGLAANLARISSFSKLSVNQEVVYGLLEESKYFIEWTAKETNIEVATELVAIQLQLAIWQIKLPTIWQDAAQRLNVAEVSAKWSKNILEKSGLLNR